MKKLLLCRPRGGFNDILNQIYLCWEYAKKYDRVLWVDTTRSGFKACLSHYFDATPEMNFGIPGGVDKYSCFPREFEGKILTYESLYQLELHNWTHISGGPLLTFEFDRDYAEELLLHEQCGGGDRAIWILWFLTLNNQISFEIKKKLVALGDYIAIHVRHTDLKTDYRSFYHKIKDSVGSKKAVLCTDSYECQMYARNVFPNIEMSSSIPDTQGHRIHDNSEFTCFETNVQVLTDLIVLACGREMLYSKTENNLLSGFTELALRLRGKGLRNKARIFLYGEGSFLEKIKPTPRRGFFNHPPRW